ncbi:MAG TPA: hypothetical protein PLJ62_07275 [Thermoflexales bacterium]|nr:hypothetical protein [Thermoflexales bacterium]HQW36450.1 hypothetical protein [Thermoflexales bacterium]HQX74698.1 hypothetical protein [Thermoflexales bacterium]HQZ22995.1 hypothetical protein [Thermoflexales bacterium]HQZ99980.1 hypothetical protein [Thermoflexales bacterium]
MSLLQIHINIASAVIYFNAILGIWGFINFLRGAKRVDGNYAGALALSPVLGLVQMALGLILLTQGYGATLRFVHYLYGALVVLAVPATFAFTEGRDDRGALLIYASITLLNAGFALRGYDTAMFR